MPKQQPADRRPVGGRFAGVCSVAYEVGILMSLVTLIIAGLQALGAQHSDVDEILDATHVAATVPDPGDYSVGGAYPVYRFQDGMKEPIGSAVVNRMDGSRVTFHYAPGSFIAVMGRHGRVLASNQALCRVSVGSRLGFALGQGLNVFDGRMVVATLRLTQVGENESTGQVMTVSTPFPGNIRESLDALAVLFNGNATGPVVVPNLQGKAISEFSVATQVTNRNSPLAAYLGPIVCLIVGIAYLALFRRYRGSPLLALMPVLVTRFRLSSRVRLGLHAIVGFPAMWYSSLFLLEAVSYIADLAGGMLGGYTTPDFLKMNVLFGLAIPLFLVLIAAYEIVLWRTRVSPFAPVGRWVAFRGGIYGHAARELPEHITMFCLQLIIVFAFARTIGTFFQGDLNQAIAACWPHAPPVVARHVAPLSIEGFGRSFHSLGYAFTHVPQPRNEDALFLSLDYLLFSACISACLLGYGYSLLGYAFGKYLRNIDFTVAGWLTNTVCYGPLFGYVWWRCLPPLVPLDPVVTPGAFRTLTFVVASFMNLLYTLSIWNLGTMFGVMTDKGVRRTGFYSVVRHPSYTLESIMFAMFSCRELASGAQWLAISGYLLIYWIRSEREDQFMRVSNPEYQEYRKQVPYKFIPGLY